eukprot:SAG22_NODE_1070_length_5723_cov_2.407539_8_plen_475_part_00
MHADDCPAAPGGITARPSCSITIGGAEEASHCQLLCTPGLGDGQCPAGAICITSGSCQYPSSDDAVDDKCSEENQAIGALFVFGFPRPDSCQPADISCCSTMFRDQCPYVPGRWNGPDYMPRSALNEFTELCAAVSRLEGSRNCSITNGGAGFMWGSFHDDTLACVDETCTGATVTASFALDDTCVEYVPETKSFATQPTERRFAVETTAGEFPRACLQNAPNEIKTTVSIGLQVAYGLWLVIVCALSLLDRAFLMRMISTDHLTVFFDDLYEFLGNDAEYAKFEAEAMARMRATSKYFLLSAVVPVFMHVFLVLTVSDSAHELLNGLWDNYDLKVEMYAIAINEGCVKTDGDVSFDQCQAQITACWTDHEHWAPNSDCLARRERERVMANTPLVTTAYEGETYGTKCYRSHGCIGDCCPPKPSWIRDIFLQCLAITVVIFQLYTPVLASVLVILCVLQVSPPTMAFIAVQHSI